MQLGLHYLIGQFWLLMSVCARRNYKLDKFLIHYPAILAFGCLATPEFAANINLSTGLDGNDILLISGGGAADAHWSVNQQAGGVAAAQVSAADSVNWYSGWLANGPDSAWISRSANVADNGGAGYTFSTAFDLTGFDLSTVFISGSWGIDDAGTLALNGTSISSLGNGAWGGLTSFTVPSGSALLNSGSNTLAITLTSSDDYPEAVRLEGTVEGSLDPAISATPEPSSVLLMIAGIGAVMVRRFRVRA